VCVCLTISFSSFAWNATWTIDRTQELWWHNAHSSRVRYSDLGTSICAGVYEETLNAYMQVGEKFSSSQAICFSHTNASVFRSFFYSKLRIQLKTTPHQHPDRFLLLLTRLFQVPSHCAIIFACCSQIMLKHMNYYIDQLQMYSDNEESTDQQDTGGK